MDVTDPIERNMMFPLHWFADGGHLSPKALGRAWREGEEGFLFVEVSGKTSVNVADGAAKAAADAAKQLSLQGKEPGQVPLGGSPAIFNAGIFCWSRSPSPTTLFFIRGNDG